MKVNIEEKIFSCLFLIPLILNFISIYILVTFLPFTNNSISSLFFSLIIIYYFSSRLISSLLVKEISQLHQKLIEYFKSSPVDLDNKENDLDDIRFIADSVDKLQATLISYSNKKLEDQKVDLEKKISAQVAHDIRSPLAALEMAIRTLSMVPEEDRIMIRGSLNRIRDIANNLSSKNKLLKAIEKKAPTPELLSSCIEEIATEKRLHFRSHLNLCIETELDNTYGLFANIDLTEMKRVLSNLINNATEAYDDKKGLISIGLLEEKEGINIFVKDFGKGIPPEILPKLGEAGQSFGKDIEGESSGSGLGLYHARQTIQSYGGTLKIDSTLGKGTTVTINLPKAKAPYWFVSKLSLYSPSAVMILDDDAGIHQTWDRKLLEVGCKEKDIPLFHASTPWDFSDWVQNKAPQFSHVLYLCDYELLGHEKTGLQLIEEHGLSKKAYLVTSYYEEKSVRKKCKELGVKIIPKMIAPLVPVEIVTSSPTLFYDAVHIEDDLLLRRCWSVQAKKQGIRLLSLENPHQLNDYKEDLSKEHCSFYIDQHLGDEFPSGVEVATDLYKEGFKNLYLSTGHEADLFSHLAWLQCIGKESPWDIKQ